MLDYFKPKLVPKSFLLFFFMIIGCEAKESFVSTHAPNFESISFDVVQKQLVIEPKLPENVQHLVSKWFNQKVKVDGFEGNMIFTVSDYTEEISSISDGKKVNIFLSFDVLLNKPSISEKKVIKGSVSSYGTLTGNFSLGEFDTVIQNTQSDIILRLSRNLNSKI